MKLQLSPPKSRSLTCFGMRRVPFFKLAILINTISYITCVVMLALDIAVTVPVHIKNPVLPVDEQIKLYLRYFSWSLFTGLIIVLTFLDVNLYRTKLDPTHECLYLYCKANLIMLPLYTTWYYALLIFKKYSENDSGIFPYPDTLGTFLLFNFTVYKVYFSYVVYQYAKDVEFEKYMKSGYRNLTDEEVYTFEHGNNQINEEELCNLYTTFYKQTLFLPYDRARFEITRENLDMSDAMVLGQGEYGFVYKAYLNFTNNPYTKCVAVKTVSPELNDVHQFKALLIEAKVYMYMGKHENLVELIGICTSNIRERQLLIVCELCELGNLESYLRSERASFVNTIETEGQHDSKEFPVSNLSTVDLVRWSYQVASGLGFLAEQKIIHGDLAARNVLLNANKTAKITDFGLPRRLYNYSIYQKRQNVPLPWRSLALESIVDLQFSTMSDVWAYGVCCWEIFELGKMPWEDISNFSMDFVNNLKDGVRLPKGPFCSSEMYQIMHSCWSNFPEQRPSFSTLKKLWLQMYQTYQQLYSE